MKVAQAVNYWLGLQCNIFLALKFGERFDCNLARIFLVTGTLPAAKHCRKAEPPPVRAGSFTRGFQGRQLLHFF